MGRKPSKDEASVTFRVSADKKAEIVDMAEEFGVTLRQLVLNALAYYAAVPTGPGGVPLPLRDHRIQLFETASGETDFAYVPRKMSKEALRQGLK